MPYINLRPDFITVLLQNNLAGLQLLIIILNCVGTSYRSQQAGDANAILFYMKRIALPSW